MPSIFLKFDWDVISSCKVLVHISVIFWRRVFYKMASDAHHCHYFCWHVFRQCSQGTMLSLFKYASISTRVGHADASADAHRMRINAHRCASSAYCAKNDIPFFTYKLPFWLRFSKSLGPEPHQLTNISYVESGEVLSFCVNEAREYLYRYLFQGGQTHYVENILLF